MKAIAIEEFGSSENLKEVTLEKPPLKENHVLIETYAFSINPVDWKRREGHMGGKFPMVLGGDVAGVVAEVGSEVADLKVGDRVYANALKTYAEYVRARAEVTEIIPDGISFEEAASIPLAGQTAWEALVDKGKIKEGDAVLIHAGAGGVGSLAIQIAKHFGAYVASTASAPNEEYLISLGVDHFIDYKNEDFEEKLKDYDIVLDPLGGTVQEKSYSVIKEGGRLISLVQEPDKDKLRANGIEGLRFSLQPTGSRLHELTQLLAANKLVPIVSKEYPFTVEGLKKAHEQSETGHTRGKLVVKVK